MALWTLRRLGIRHQHPDRAAVAQNQRRLWATRRLRLPAAGSLFARAYWRLQVIFDSRGQRLLLLVLLILLGAIAAVLVSSRQSQGGASTSTRSQFQGPTLPAGLRATNFTLIDQDGHGVSLASYRGRAVVLTFIHSQCHDQCPFMVEQIKGALNNLPAGGSNVPVLGISVAPAEDTPSSRRRFLRLHEMQRR